MNDSAPADLSPDGEDLPAIELELKATPKQVFLAIVEVAERAGCAAEVVQPAQPPGRPCRVAARLIRPPAAGPAGAGVGVAGVGVAEPGPVLLVYEFKDAGRGYVHLRITQCGFGDQAAWDAAFEAWRGRDGRPGEVQSPRSKVQSPGAQAIDLGWGTWGVGRRAGGVPGLTLGRAWPQPGVLPGRGIHGPVVAALGQKIEAASVRLLAMRREVVRRQSAAVVGR